MTRRTRSPACFKASHPGIGFLGAGTILKLDKKQEIKGLTTASSIWLAAALGSVAGLGEYAIAVAAAVISLFVLGVLGPIEKFFERQQAESRRERKEYDELKAERNRITRTHLPASTGCQETASPTQRATRWVEASGQVWRSRKLDVFDLVFHRQLDDRRRRLVHPA